MLEILVHSTCNPTLIRPAQHPAPGPSCAIHGNQQTPWSPGHLQSISRLVQLHPISEYQIRHFQTMWLSLPSLWLRPLHTSSLTPDPTSLIFPFLIVCLLAVRRGQVKSLPIFSIFTLSPSLLRRKWNRHRHRLHFPQDGPTAPPPCTLLEKSRSNEKLSLPSIPPCHQPHLTSVEVIRFLSSPSPSLPWLLVISLPGTRPISPLYLSLSYILLSHPPC